MKWNNSLSGRSLSCQTWSLGIGIQKTLGFLVPSSFSFSVVVVLCGNMRLCSFFSSSFGCLLLCKTVLVVKHVSYSRRNQRKNGRYSGALFFIQDTHLVEFEYYNRYSTVF